MKHMMPLCCCTVQSIHVRTQSIFPKICTLIPKTCQGVFCKWNIIEFIHNIFVQYIHTRPSLDWPWWITLDCEFIKPFSNEFQLANMVSMASPNTPNTRWQETAIMHCKWEALPHKIYDYENKCSYIWFRGSNRSHTSIIYDDLSVHRHHKNSMKLLWSI